MNADLKTKQTLNLLLQPRHTLRSPFGQGVPRVEAVMAYVLNEVLLYCCLAAFVTGIVLAAASLIS